MKATPTAIGCREWSLIELAALFGMAVSWCRKTAWRSLWLILPEQEPTCDQWPSSSE